MEVLKRLRIDAKAVEGGGSLNRQKQNVMNEATAEEESWRLLLSRMKHDMQLMRMAKSRMESYEGAVYQKKLLHRKQAWDVSKTAATSFMQSHCLIVCSTKPDEFLRSTERFMQTLSSSFGVSHEIAAWFANSIHPQR